jgi:hypothetical protein
MQSFLAAQEPVKLFLQSSEPDGWREMASGVFTFATLSKEIQRAFSGNPRLFAQTESRVLDCETAS